MTSPSDLQARMNALGFRSQADAERFMKEQFEDHASFCQRLKIRNKQGVAVPFNLAPGPQKLFRKIAEQERQGLPVRGMLLKFRQGFFSASIATLIYKRTAFLRGQQSLVFGDTYKAARNIWGYIDQYAATYNPDGGIRPLPVKSRRKDEKLEWEGGSWVEVNTAENPNAGRSFSLRHLHLSESAFWRDARTLRTGLLQCVPDDPGTTILDESTANGVGGPFYERWQELTDPGYRGGWFALFFGWHEHPEYVRPLDMPARDFEQSMSREEQQLRVQYRLSLEQVHWRRWAITNKCDGSIERFHQEYPASAEEAFLTSGRPRFCLISLGRMPAVRDTLSGDLERVRVGTGEQIRFTPALDNKGSVRVFRRPVLNRYYVIGADPAEGIDVREDKGEADPDYSDACVLDQETGEQVACFSLRLEPDPFADYVALLGEWYNWAFLVPEVNSVGLAFIQALLYRKYPEHLIYHRDRDPDDRRPAMLQELGWKENTSTRQQLVSHQDRMIRDGSLILHCPHCISQHRTFIIKPNGRPEHQDGCHDDSVFAAALAGIGIETAARVRAKIAGLKRPVSQDPDWDDDDRPARGNRFGGRYGYRSVR